MIDRRTLVGAGLAAPALLMLEGARAATKIDPFTLGVASGDPSPDGMVLWTRLAPEPLRGDGGMPPHPVPVRWELAEDEHFRRIVRHGTAMATPEWGHSVHVEPAGLRPDRHYWYRFITGGAVSPVGRTRTAPAKGAAVDRLRLCYGSCHKYEVGYYASYAHMVQDDPDMIVFVGDYIYEADPDPKSLRPHLNPEPFDVPGYRVRYATYKLDPQLQAAHAAVPWVLTWDDHEVANDYAGIIGEHNEDLAKRRAAAYKVYYEHQPLRLAQRPAPDGATHLFRLIDWGSLAQFQVLDDRQYRGARPCQPPELAAQHKHYLDLVKACPDFYEPYRTMLGHPQEAWLMDALGHTRARWNLLTQQTLMAPLHRFNFRNPKEPGFEYWSADTWAGWPAARDRVFARWVDAKTSNPIVLSGDIHCFAATDIGHPARPDGPPIASEFVGGSLTSLFHDATVKKEGAFSDFKYIENEVRGYGLVDLTSDHAAVVFRGLNDATRRDSGAYDLVRYAVEAGRPGMQSA